MGKCHIKSTNVGKIRRKGELRVMFQPRLKPKNKSCSRIKRASVICSLDFLRGARGLVGLV